MFTIFGATGNTGAIVARQLLAKGKQVRVVGRDAAKLAELAGAEAVSGDVTNSITIARALARCDEGAYLLLPPDVKSPDVLARNRRLADSYIAQIGAQRTKHVVVLSSIGAQHASGNGPIAGNHYCEETFPKAAPDTKFTFLRPGAYMENILNYAHAMTTDGVLPVFGGGASYPFPMVATKDVGEAAANALLSPPTATEVVELSGPKDYSYDDAAAAASEVLGKAVKTAAVPIEQMVPTLVTYGMSENFAMLMREMTEAGQKGLLAHDPKARQLRGATTLVEFLRAALAK